jgi:hypothetical protein
MTEVMERGANLSGGQKHRLALARALYSDADIYLLDDPLSSLDTVVADTVFKEAVLGLLQNKTRIMVTQNIDALECADSILVMDRCLGSSNNAVMDHQPIPDTFRIVDQGSLGDLRSRGGFDVYFHSANESESKSNTAQKSPRFDIISGDDERTVIGSDLLIQQSDGSIMNATNDFVKLPQTTTGFQNPSNVRAQVPSSSGDRRTLAMALRGRMFDLGNNFKWFRKRPFGGDNNVSLTSATVQSFPVVPANNSIFLQNNKLLYYYVRYIQCANNLPLVGYVLLAFLSASTGQFLLNKIIVQWTSDSSYTKHSLSWYLSLVGVYSVAVAVFNCLRTYLLTALGAASSEHMHGQMVQKVMRAPLNFLGTDRTLSLLCKKYYHASKRFLC